MSGYISVGGLTVINEAQAKNANNLANLNTVGFRAEKTEIFSVPVEGDGFKTRVYAQSSDTAFDATPGVIKATGNPLDIAIVENGWISVLSTNGNEAYTRRGDLKLDADGNLINGAGNFVLGENGIINIPHGSVSILKDGTISLIPANADNGVSIELDRIKLVNPNVKEMQRREDGLFELKDRSMAFSDYTVKLEVGALEQSNVQAFSELTEFLELARKYELNVKMMQKEDENDKSSSNLVSLR